MEALFVSRLFLVQFRVSLGQTTNGASLIRFRRELAWWLLHSPLICRSHIMQDESGFLVCLLLRSGTWTTVSTSESSDKLTVTFSSEPLAPSINNWSSDDSSLSSVAVWLVSKAERRSDIGRGIPLTRTDCWLTITPHAWIYWQLQRCIVNLQLWTHM